MNMGSRFVVKYRLRQALNAILVSRLNIMAGLMNERRRLPEQDQGREQPDCNLFTVQAHIQKQYRTLTKHVKKKRYHEWGQVSLRTAASAVIIAAMTARPLRKYQVIHLIISTLRVAAVVLFS